LKTSIFAIGERDRRQRDMAGSEVQGGDIWLYLGSLRVKRIAAPQVRLISRQPVLPK
jgi:hypothetical protein